MSAEASRPAVEIERKFLVTAPPPDLDRHPAGRMRQGYLAIEPGGNEVRIRISGRDAVLTVKRGGGLTRVEEEVPIEAAAFDRLWPLTEGRRVEKTRHLVPVGDGLVAELDVYAGALDGLLTAEIEFRSEAEAHAFSPPDWLGADVTEDDRFKNYRLAVDGRPDR